MQGPKSKKNILIIDDDEVFAKSTKEYLGDGSIEIFTAQTGQSGISLCSKTRFDVVLLDQKLPDGEGAGFCPEIIATNERIKIIFITAFPSFENALKAIENGAFTYLSKPIEPREIKIAIAKCLHIMDLEKSEEGLRYKENRENEQTVLIGYSPAINQVSHLIALAAETDANVLITGETGTGKSLVARMIHLHGQKRGAFLTINCAALPENLIEAELFGYEKGSFSGAVASKKGLFEIAEDGTTLLDEIGEMGVHLQAKLLGVLDDKKIRRIGGTVGRTVTSRIIASTNSQIENKLKTGEFREDLYYRLNVVRIHLPPLRERASDIPELADYFLRTMSPNRKIILPDNEVNAIITYPWPGNVRELKNVIERSLILHPGGAPRPSQLLEKNRFHSVDTVPEPEKKISSLAEVERQTIHLTLARLGGNFTQTAKALGISLSTLKRKIKKYQLQ